MTSKKSGNLNRFIFLFLAVWPLIYGSIFICIWLYKAMNPSAENDTFLGMLMLCHVATMGISFAGIVLYLINLYHNKQIWSSKKTTWALGILFLSPICLPIYWWRYVR